MKIASRAAGGARPPKAGFTLIECLVYLTVLAIVTGLAFTAYFQCQQNTVELRRNAEDIIRALRAGERWRQDVRAATGKPRRLENGRLLIPQKAGTVIYSFSQGSVRRQAGAHTAEIEILRDIKNSEMKLDARRRVTAWRWELELAGRQKQARVRPLFTFEAVGAPAS